MSNYSRGFSSLILLIAVGVVLATSGYFLTKGSVPAAPVAETEQVLEDTSEPSVSLPLTLSILRGGRSETVQYDTERYSALTEIAKTPSKMLACIYKRYGETMGCIVLIIDTDARTAVELGLPDYKAEESVLPSPDNKHFLFATEDRVIVIDAATLEYRTVYESKEGTVPGIYGCFPTFKAKVRWDSATTIKVPVYDKEEAQALCDKEPAPNSVETLTISIP